MRIDKIICDNCEMEMKRVECAVNQNKFILQETMDEGECYDFCGAECLKTFVLTKKFEKRFYNQEITVSKGSHNLTCTNSKEDKH